MSVTIIFGFVIVSISIFLLAKSISECGDALDRIANNLNSANCISMEKKINNTETLKHDIEFLSSIVKKLDEMIIQSDMLRSEIKEIKKIYEQGENI